MKTSEFFANETRRDARRLLREYGENLKRRRKERGITLIELAEKTDISKENIKNIELGLEELARSKKQKIEKFLRRQRII